MWDFEGAACSLVKPALGHKPEVIRGPGPASAQKVLSFIQAYIDAHHEKKDGLRILFHCHAGKSRSTAFALGVMRYFAGPFTETMCADKLLEIRPLAGPNLTIVGHFDHLLGCGGALVSAVADNPVMVANHNRSDIGRAIGLKRAFMIMSHREALTAHL